MLWIAVLKTFALQIWIFFQSLVLPFWKTLVYHSISFKYDCCISRYLHETTIKQEQHVRKSFVMLRLSLKWVNYWTCKNILKLCETFLKSPAGKKYRISICFHESRNRIFLDWSNEIKLVPVSFIELLWKKLTKL